jgi:hypothetical protein
MWSVILLYIVMSILACSTLSEQLHKFRVKNHDFMPKKITFFPILGGGQGAPPSGSAPGFIFHQVPDI